MRLYATRLFALTFICAFVSSIQSLPTYEIVSRPTHVMGRSIPRNFLGFSSEVSSILRQIGESGHTRSFAQLLANLLNSKNTNRGTSGPVVRIGGNSADKSCIVNDNSSDSTCSYHVTQADYAAYATFASETAAAINMSFVIDLNFGFSADPNDEAVPEVKYLLSEHSLKNYVKAFEIGNEIDLYAEHGEYRNDTYDWNDYFSEFGHFAQAIKSELQSNNSKFVQGGTFAKEEWGFGGQSKDLTDYLDAYSSVMRTLSWHMYALSTCNNNTVTIKQLLSKRASDKPLRFAPISATCEKYDIDFVLGETNSASCGGQSGVSDVFAAALWVMAYLSRASQAGAQGVNFHGGPHGPYAPIQFGNKSKPEQFKAMPLYYGMFAFAKFIEDGGQWINDTTVTLVSGLSTEGHISDEPSGDPLCENGISSGNVCCAIECGVCGGTGCDKRPGGADDCCSSKIEKANHSCTSHHAPCIIDWTFVPVLEAYSVVTETALRSIVLAKNSERGAMGRQTGAVNVKVCPSNSTQMSPHSQFSNNMSKSLHSNTAQGQIFRLSGKSNISATVGRGDISFCGQIFDGSIDGAPVGNCVSDSVDVDRNGCVAFVLPPFEAAVVIQPLI